MLGSDYGALDIENGEELLRFDLGTVLIRHTQYTVLTRYEGPERRCFWCGGELKGKLKRYCYGHMQEYYRHFEWSTARRWCFERQEGQCANCGKGDWHKDLLEIHHIVPINGGVRYFTAFNLPWNLIGLCHDCHQEIHATMRPPKLEKVKQGNYDEMLSRGQLPMKLEHSY